MSDTEYNPYSIAASYIVSAKERLSALSVLFDVPTDTIEYITADLDRAISILREEDLMELDYDEFMEIIGASDSDDADDDFDDVISEDASEVEKLKAEIEGMRKQMLQFTKGASDSAQDIASQQVSAQTDGLTAEQQRLIMAGMKAEKEKAEAALAEAQAAQMQAVQAQAQPAQAAQTQPRDDRPQLAQMTQQQLVQYAQAALIQAVPQFTELDQETRQAMIAQYVTQLKVAQQSQMQSAAQEQLMQRQQNRAQQAQTASVPQQQVQQPQRQQAPTLEQQAAMRDKQDQMNIQQKRAAQARGANAAVLPGSNAAKKQGRPAPEHEEWDTDSNSISIGMDIAHVPLAAAEFDIHPAGTVSSMYVECWDKSIGEWDVGTLLSDKALDVDEFAIYGVLGDGSSVDVIWSASDKTVTASVQAAHKVGLLTEATLGTARQKSVRPGVPNASAIFEDAPASSPDEALSYLTELDVLTISIDVEYDGNNYTLYFMDKSADIEVTWVQDENFTSSDLGYFLLHLAGILPEYSIKKDGDRALWMKERQNSTKAGWYHTHKTTYQIDVSKARTGSNMLMNLAALTVNEDGRLTVREFG